MDGGGGGRPLPSTEPAARAARARLVLCGENISVIGRDLRKRHLPLISSSSSSFRPTPTTAAAAASNPSPPSDHPRRHHYLIVHRRDSIIRAVPLDSVICGDSESTNRIPARLISEVADRSRDGVLRGRAGGQPRRSLRLVEGAEVAR